MPARRRRRGPRGQLAERIRQARGALGLTQREAAETLGVARETLARWETGAYHPVGPARKYVEHWIDQALGKEVEDGE